MTVDPAKTSCDTLIIGSGVSGSFIAMELAAAGHDCLMLEAGRFFDRYSYPDNELDANTQLFWAGGIELNTNADLAFLRPKCVGGGSIVNQALMDRLDDEALESWAKTSGLDFFSSTHLEPFYSRAEAELKIEMIPERYWSGNCQIFKEGCDKNGYKWAPLRRAQANCRYEDGNDCIECLAGCPLDSKQSMPVTVLKKALAQGLRLISECEVLRINKLGGHPGAAFTIEADHRGESKIFHAKNIVLAAGAIGNSTLLLRSGFAANLPAVGRGFYSHPQEMTLAIYDREIKAYKSGFQALKSADPNFKRQGFKLENIFAPPVSLAMLLPTIGRTHQALMKQVNHMACIEVAVRDTNPGHLQLGKRGQVFIHKSLNHEDRQRKKRGLEAIHKIFKATGAKDIIDGQISIGLHLMGGCAIGKDRRDAVVAPDFKVHGEERIFAADSSIFPNAPGFNPSLTIMALSLKAAGAIKAAC